MASLNVLKQPDINPGKMSNPLRIIYIKPANSSFILSDQRILEKQFQVIPYLVPRPAKKFLFPLGLLRLFFFLMWNGWRCRAFVCWFGDYHAAVMVFSGKLLRKKTIIFAGGQEAVCYKELGKGVYLNPVRGEFVKYALRNASMLLPNHVSLMYHENHFYQPGNPHIDGINHYVGKVKGVVNVIPNGIDFTRISRDPSIVKDPDLVLTVGTMSSEADFYNKGFDLFIELARRMPERKFVMIGVNRNYMTWMEEKYRPAEVKNLTVIPSYCPDDILKQYFNQAKVYLQISITEGMPVSLGEAMLCECIPVGSNVNGIPDAIGDTGIIVFQREIGALTEAVNKAMTLDTGDQAREHTLSLFSMELREERILKAFSGIPSC
jgi:glycosyltransferase involved in cell wall biosynthesis